MAQKIEKMGRSDLVLGNEKSVPIIKEALNKLFCRHASESWHPESALRADV